MQTRITTSLASLAFVASMCVATPMAYATTAEQSQEVDQDVKVECTTGAYGQNSTCKVESNQSAKQQQKIVLRDGTVLAAHTPVNTGIDAQVAVALVGLVGSGVAGLVASKFIA